MVFIITFMFGIFIIFLNVLGIIDTHIAIHKIPSGETKFTIDDARKYCNKKLKEIENEL